MSSIGILDMDIDTIKLETETNPLLADTASVYPRRSARRHERGFTLAAVITIMTVIMLVIAYSVPKQWSLILQRERELQTIFVMEQYARGIQNFQRVHGALPVNLEQIEKQTDPRVMRQMYPNPLSGEMDWILIPAAEAGKPGGASDDQNDRGNRRQNNRGARRGNQGPGQPFIGVRPPQTGQTIIELNGAASYEDWSFTIQDLQKSQPGGGESPPG